jgi:UPF0716 protein FxsA
VRKVLTGLTVLTVLELVVIIEVAEHFGTVNTLGLLLVVAVVGCLIVKAQGLRTLRRLMGDLQERRVPGRTLADGALLATAGVLLVFPGFLTDIAGLLLLLAPVRAGIRRWLSVRWSRRFVTSRTVTLRPERPDRPELTQ